MTQRRWMAERSELVGRLRAAARFMGYTLYPDGPNRWVLVGSDSTCLGDVRALFRGNSTTFSCEAVKIPLDRPGYTTARPVPGGAVLVGLTRTCGQQRVVRLEVTHSELTVRQLVDTLDLLSSVAAEIRRDVRRLHTAGSSGTERAVATMLTERSFSVSGAGR